MKSLSFRVARLQDEIDNLTLSDGRSAHGLFVISEEERHSHKTQDSAKPFTISAVKEGSESDKFYAISSTAEDENIGYRDLVTLYYMMEPLGCRMDSPIYFFNGIDDKIEQAKVHSTAVRELMPLLGEIIREGHINIARILGDTIGIEIHDKAIPNHIRYFVADRGPASSSGGGGIPSTSRYNHNIDQLLERAAEIRIDAVHRVYKKLSEVIPTEPLNDIDIIAEDEGKIRFEVRMWGATNPQEAQTFLDQIFARGNLKEQAGGPRGFEVSEGMVKRLVDEFKRTVAERSI